MVSVKSIEVGVAGLTREGYIKEVTKELNEDIKRVYKEYNIDTDDMVIDLYKGLKGKIGDERYGHIEVDTSGEYYTNNCKISEMTINLYEKGSLNGLVIRIRYFDEYLNGYIDKGWYITVYKR